MYSYQFGANPPIDYVRFLIPDTMNTTLRPCIFQDEEIRMATAIQSLTWQSGQFWSGVQGAYLPSPPVSYRRVAATCIDSIANNRARLSAVTKLLDVELSPTEAAKMLHEGAECLRREDDAGAFAIIEQVQFNNPASLRERFWAQIQRQSAV